MTQTNRDVVVHLLLDGEQVCAWLLSVPSDISNEDAYDPIVETLLPQAIADGEINHGDGMISFSLRDADIAIDFDLYAALAGNSGSIH